MFAESKYCLYLQSNQCDMINKNYISEIAGFGTKSSRVSDRTVLRGFLFGAGLTYYHE